MDTKEKKVRALETDELADVRGGSFMPADCPDLGTSECTENSFTCKTEEKNKSLCKYFEVAWTRFPKPEYE